MMMRVYALYARSRRVLILMCILSVISVIYDVVQAFGFPGKPIGHDTIQHITDALPINRRLDWQHRHQLRREVHLR